jgi:hypothetical protein
MPTVCSFQQLVYCSLLLHFPLYRSINLHIKWNKKIKQLLQLKPFSLSTLFHLHLQLYCIGNGFFFCFIYIYFNKKEIINLRWFGQKKKKNTKRCHFNWCVNAYVDKWWLNLTDVVKLDGKNTKWLFFKFAKLKT